MSASLTLLCAVLCLGAAAEAQAYGLERDYRWALRYWGERPTRCLFVERATVPAWLLAPGRWGEATKMPKPGKRQACTLYVRKRLSRCVRRQVVVHEVGHLLGRPHSEDDPGSVMYPSILSRWRPDLCPWQVV